MVEFKVKIRVDTQDPKQAYETLRAGLAFTGVQGVISDCWLVNNRPLPKDCAQKIAFHWQKEHKQDGFRFASNDPAFQTQLDNLHDAMISIFKGESKCDAKDETG